MQRYFEPLFIGIPVEQIPFSSWLEWFDKIGKKKPKNAGHLLRRLKSILNRPLVILVWGRFGKRRGKP
ncbi:hypothetical protein [Aeromonas allosaccharophila]|uniref:hypothetical protein n=1 Tax=Aeromonas allosaccharophila TaxID=656 RepID=UPI003D21599F